MTKNLSCAVAVASNLAVDDVLSHLFGVKIRQRQTRASLVPVDVDPNDGSASQQPSGDERAEPGERLSPCPPLNPVAYC